MYICVQAVVLDLMMQTRDLRSELGQKEQNLTLMRADLSDITVSVNIMLLFKL